MGRKLTKRQRATQLLELKKAIDVMGGISELALQAEISYASISKYRVTGVPAARVLQIYYVCERKKPRCGLSLYRMHPMERPDKSHAKPSIHEEWWKDALAGTSILAWKGAGE